MAKGKLPWAFWIKALLVNYLFRMFRMYVDVARIIMLQAVLDCMGHVMLRSSTTPRMYAIKRGDDVDDDVDVGVDVDVEVDVDVDVDVDNGV